MKNFYACIVTCLAIALISWTAGFDFDRRGWDVSYVVGITMVSMFFASIYPFDDN